MENLDISKHQFLTKIKELTYKIENLQAELTEEKQRHKNGTDITDIYDDKNPQITETKDLRAILNSAEDLIFLKNIELQYTFVNESMKKLLGLFSSEIIGKTDQDIFGKAVFANTKISDSSVLEGNVVDLEQTYSSQNGFHKFQILKTPVTNLWGDVVGICGIGRNITTLKAKEDELNQREGYFRSIINTSRDAIFIKDTTLKYILINPAMEKLLGQSASQLIGKQETEIFGEEVNDYLKKVDSSVLTGKIIEEENIYDVNGVQTILHTVKYPLRNEKDEIIGLCGISRDITDHRLAETAAHKSEKQYQALLNAMPDLMLQVNKQGTITDYQPAKNIKLGEPDNLMGKNLTEIFPEESSKKTLSLLKKSMKEGTLQIYEFEDQNDGTTNYYEARINHIDKDEQLIIVRDISERKIAEEELKKRNEELDAFAHTVAHDLKNPVAAIISMMDVLKHVESKITPERREFFMDSINQDAQKMQNIIKELLLLAGVRKQKAEKELLDMQKIVSEALHRLAYMVKQTNTEIILPLYWPFAVGYGPWIEEVWTNYISNAIKYGGEPPIVELGATQKDDGTVEFWVKDNGKGLTPEEQGQLFSEFTRLHQVRAEGQGLGLSIVRRIMDKLGGKVGVTSEVGNGSVFSFYLPTEMPQEDNQ